MSEQHKAERMAVRLAYELSINPDHTHGFYGPLYYALEALVRAAVTAENDPFRHGYVQQAIQALGQVPTGKL